MIGRIRGTLVEKIPPDIVIEAAGVGYEIQVPMTSFYKLPSAGEEVALFTHFVVREDAQLLFGFYDKHERTLFRELIKANGVGPKLALTILSGMSAEQFVSAVEHDDVTALVKLPGVGKKTAERLLVEMRDRLKKLARDGDITSVAPLVADSAPTFSHNDVKDDALGALLALGYKEAQAKSVVQQVYSDEMTSEQLIKQALKAML